MNYEKIYNNFIIDFINTDVKTRIIRRNPRDLRLNSDNLYVERHHIVPRSEGGMDSEDNIVSLLPEEHLFIHYLRYKVYGKYNDICAVNLMLNGFFGKKLEDIHVNKILRKKFKYQREAFSRFIKANNSGHPRISEARRGKMPVKDFITGEMIGSVDVNHENVLGGKWVHHSKGKSLKKDQKEYLSKRNRGLKNFNAHNIKNEEYLEQTIDYIKTCSDGRFIKSEYKKYCEEKNLIYIINFSKHRWNGSRKKFIEALRKECNNRGIEFEYDRYYRSSQQKQQIRESSLGKKRFYHPDGSFTLQRK